MADQGYQLSEELLRQIQNCIRWQRNFRVSGAGLVNKPDSCSISIPSPTPASSARFGREMQFVKVTSAASGGGKYNGNLWTLHTTTPAATGDLAEADFGVAGVAVLIFNAAEAGASTHDLTTGTPKSKIFPAVFIGMTSGGVPVFGVNAVDWEACT